MQGMEYEFSLEFVEISSIGHRKHPWYLTETSWIVSSQGQNPLMWVPREAQVVEPPAILVISRHGFGFVDFRQSMIGVKWVGCYTPS